MPGERETECPVGLQPRVIRRNGEDMVGLGIIRNAKANTLEVIRGVKERVAKINATLPADMQMYPSYDSSVYIDAAIGERIRGLLATETIEPLKQPVVDLLMDRFVQRRRGC